MLSSTYLQCVVALAALSSTDGAEWTGSLTQTAATGFLYAFPHSGRDEDDPDEFRHLWLVTCKHVIRNLRNDGFDQIIARMNQMDQQNMMGFTIPLREHGNVPRWYLHPTRDIAVIPASWQLFDDHGIQWRTFAEGRSVFTRREAAKYGLGEGDTVFILGFPTGWREGRQDYPIARHGVLAQTRGWLKGEHETFLVDGSGFPGNSGGPVIVTTSEFDALMGMVSASIKLPIVAGLNETADLIEVIPMEAINEVIHFAIQQRSDNS